MVIHVEFNVSFANLHHRQAEDNESNGNYCTVAAYNLNTTVGRDWDRTVEPLGVKKLEKKKPMSIEN